MYLKTTPVLQIVIIEKSASTFIYVSQNKWSLRKDSNFLKFNNLYERILTARFSY